MDKSGFLLGLDIGSSSIKAALLKSDTGELIASTLSPKSELEIIGNQPGWAEQHPDTWWAHVKLALQELKALAPSAFHDIRAIGLAYQMHGLVMVDNNHEPLMNSIIWCDSRAVDIGNQAFTDLGNDYCLKNFLNSPGNFTACKLKWIQMNRPDIYNKIYKIMLPGDYIAMKLTGELSTTPSGLSEGILWDYARRSPAHALLDYFNFNADLLPNIVPTFSVQGLLRPAVAEELGIPPGIPITYRAGDQPNNALSLNVLNPGEIAATAGTSGVIYGVTDSTEFDPACRVNTFVHVNDTLEKPRYGLLLCVNGTGILNRWVRNLTGGNNGSPQSYRQMNAAAALVPPGSDNLLILPYGNGAERTLLNKNIHASLHGLDLTVHTQAHLFRATQEGIVFALRYGLDVMRSMGVEVQVIRAGYANMFQSRIFAETFATVCNTRLELYNTDGAQGAARGAGIGSGIYSTSDEAFYGLTKVDHFEPDARTMALYDDVYSRWTRIVHDQIIR